MEMGESNFPRRQAVSQGCATYAAADRSQWIRLAGVAVGFLVLPFRNQGHITPRLRVNRTGLHAGEIGFQPVQVHEFCPLRAHDPAPLDSQSRDFGPITLSQTVMPGSAHHRDVGGGRS